MIERIEIINQPSSGELHEVIYESNLSFRSSEWTWVRFIDDEMYDWCGEFRGKPVGCAISSVFNTAVVLTTDVLYILDKRTGNELSQYASDIYTGVTVSPKGEYFITTYYGIEVFCEDFRKSVVIELPINADSLEIVGWEKENLVLKSTEIMNYDELFYMELNSLTYEIVIKNVT